MFCGPYEIWPGAFVHPRSIINVLKSGLTMHDARATRWYFIDEQPIDQLTPRMMPHPTIDVDVLVTNIIRYERNANTRKIQHQRFVTLLGRATHQWFLWVLVRMSSFGLTRHIRTVPSNPNRSYDPSSDIPYIWRKAPSPNEWFEPMPWQFQYTCWQCFAPMLTSCRCPRRAEFVWIEAMYNVYPIYLVAAQCMIHEDCIAHDWGRVGSLASSCIAERRYEIDLDEPKSNVFESIGQISSMHDDSLLMLRMMMLDSS